MLFQDAGIQNEVRTYLKILYSIFPVHNGSICCPRHWKRYAWYPLDPPVTPLQNKRIMPAEQEKTKFQPFRSSSFSVFFYLKTMKQKPLIVADLLPVFCKNTFIWWEIYIFCPSKNPLSSSGSADIPHPRRSVFHHIRRSVFLEFIHSSSSSFLLFRIFAMADGRKGRLITAGITGSFQPLITVRSSTR